MRHAFVHISFIMLQVGKPRRRSKLVEVEVADANLKLFASKPVSFLKASSELLTSRDFYKAHRYEGKLMEKFQQTEDQKLKVVGD